jgi:2-polyprenyl-3-methyl-5-hydroxy-6-metoxy-1,4-benzoquinol methylase
MSQPALDEAKLEAFIERFVGDAAASAHSATVVLGDKLGLFKALAEGGPQTSDELASRAGCHPRLVQEWLNAQAASEYCLYDPATTRYSLTPEQVAVLADDGSPVMLISNMQMVSTLHHDIEGLRSAYSDGHGFGWHEHHGDLFVNMARSSTADYSAFLVSEWIPALKGVEEKLLTGARVADIGCGFGGPTIMLAQAYPKSTFHGFDYHVESIEAARKAAADAGVSERVTFEVVPADSFPGTYDLVGSFDAFHDMGDPIGVARHIRESLTPEGTWMIAELNAGDSIEENVNPFGRMLYSASSFICVPNAVSQSDSRALGAAVGKAVLEEVTREAGFTRFRLAAETPFNLILEVRP